MSQSNQLTLVQRFAERFQVDADKLFDTLKATAFKQRDGSVPTNEQMMALLLVAEQYSLNPFTREIFAFPDKQAGIIPVVGVDGWSRILNLHEQFDGMEFEVSPQMICLEGSKECPEWMQCVIYRRDRRYPVKITEYLDEVYRPPFQGQGKNGGYQISGPWQTHTKRMLRHKTMIQCARLAFGFVGIFDQDEAERIVEAQSSAPQAQAAFVRSAPIEVNQPLDMTTIDQATQQKVAKLVSRAQAANAWASALDYAKEHFQDQALVYATQSLTQAQQQQLLN